MPALTNGIDRRLAPKHQGCKGQGSERPSSEVQLKLAGGQDTGAKASRQTPMITPAIVKLPMRHAFGIGDGHTLTVVNDIARKSPATMMMTISSGVRTT